MPTNRGSTFGEETALGCGCVVLSLAPVIVLGALAVLHFVYIENGLLIALWLFLTLPASILLLIIGVIADRRGQ